VKIEDLIEEALKFVEKSQQKPEQGEGPQVSVYELQEVEEDLEAFLKQIEKSIETRAEEQSKPQEKQAVAQKAAAKKIVKIKPARTGAKVKGKSQRVQTGPDIDTEKIALLNELSEAKRIIADLNDQIEAQNLRNENLLKQKEQEIQELAEQINNIHVEYSNFKRRMEREKEEFKKFSLEEFITKLLPILDDMELALKHVNEDSDREAIIEGIDMVSRKFYHVLSSFGVEPIEAESCKFNPEFHEAMAQIESEEHESGIITAEVQKGFTMHGRLLRPSKVIVSKNKQKG